MWYNQGIDKRERGVMTSEDYMNTYEWDNEIEVIIQDMREKLYDLKAQYITIHDDGTVVMKDVDE